MSILICTQSSLYNITVKSIVLQKLLAINVKVTPAHWMRKLKECEQFRL